MKNCRFKPPNLPKKSPKPKNLSPESLQISKKLCTSCGTETRDLFSKIDRQVYNSKGNKCDKPMHVLRGHSTMAMYVRPKDLKDQLVLGYILDRVGFYE